MQRVQRERRVAQPAVAVVPVAHAADRLGQRGGRRGDDAAGRRVRQRLERDQAALDQLAVRPVDGRARPDHSCHQRVVSCASPRGRRRGWGSGSCDGCQVSTNGTSSPASSSNSATVVRSRPRVGRPGMRCTASGPGDRRQPAVLAAPDPRDDPAVVEAQDELHAHGHASLEAADDAHDVGRLVADRHEVDDLQHAAGGVEVRLEHERAVAVAPLRARDLARRARAASGRASRRRAARRSRPGSRSAGRQSQSIEPSRPTSAAVCVSPISA